MRKKTSMRGVIIRMAICMVSSSMMVAILEPAAAPTIENIVAIKAIFKFTAFPLIYLIEANRVPKNPENLFVPRAKWAGIPIDRYAGRVIIPPPPAIESIKPPRKTRNSKIPKFVADISITIFFYNFNRIMSKDKEYANLIGNS